MQNKINSIPEQHADLDSQRPDGGQARVSTKRGPVTVAQVRWSKLFAEGWRLAKLCRQLVLVYVLLYLIQGFAQNFGVQFVGTVTNKLNELVHSSANGPVAGGPDAQEEGSGRPRKEGSLTTFLKRYSLSRFLDRLSLEQTYFAWVILAILGIGLAVPVQWLGTKMDLLMSNQLRSELFGRVLQKPPGFFHENDPGKVNAIVNTMPVEMQMALRKITVDQIPQLILLAGTAAMLIDNLTQLSGDIPVLGFRVPTIAAPPCIVVVGFGFCYLILKMKDQLQGGGRRLQKAMLVLNTLVTGAAQAPEEIQALRAEPLFSRKLDLALNEASNARLNQQLTVGKLNVLGQLPEFVVQVLFLGVGVYVAHSAAQSSGSGQIVGNIIAIFGLAPRLISPINALSGSMLMVLQSWPSIETVIATMGVLTRSDHALESSNLVHLAPTIEARNVVFSYSDDSGKVFDGISFRIPAGMRTGLVAKLGQGKTTFFKLALRFYDPLGYLDLGDAMTMLGDLEPAAGEYQSALKSFSMFVQKNSPGTDWRHNLSLTYARIGYILYRQGKTREAQDSYRKAVDA